MTGRAIREIGKGAGEFLGGDNAAEDLTGIITLSADMHASAGQAGAIDVSAPLISLRNGGVVGSLGIEPQLGCGGRARGGGTA